MFSKVSASCDGAPAYPGIKVLQDSFGLKIATQARYVQGSSSHSEVVRKRSFENADNRRLSGESDWFFKFYNHSFEHIWIGDSIDHRGGIGLMAVHLGVFLPSS